MSKVSVQFVVWKYDALQTHTVKLIFNENLDLYDKESLQCSGMKDHKLFGVISLYSACLTAEFMDKGS